MTQDLRQAILALTNAVKEVEGHALEGLRDNVLALMPAGPILETLWAGLPVPVGVMGYPRDSNWWVEACYDSQDAMEHVHLILGKPLEDHLALLAAMKVNEEAEAIKLRAELKHAQEKRLLAERDSFTVIPDREPELVAAFREKLDGMAFSSFLNTEEQDGAVAEAAADLVAKVKELATAPAHVVVEEAEGEAQADGEA